MLALTVALAAFLQGASPDVVLLDFSATWCGPCKKMAPTVQQLQRSGYPVRMVDFDAERDLARRFRVDAVPTFILLADGEVAGRIVGGTSYSNLAELFHSAGFRPGGGTTFRGQSPDPPSPPEYLQEEPLVELPKSVEQTAPKRYAPGSISRGAPAAPKDIALGATVRLTVKDDKGQSHGTGTIIDVFGKEALVLTCGHVFRESKGSGIVSVEFCGHADRPSVPGKVLDWEADERDVALVIIRPGFDVTPARVADGEYKAKISDAVFSIGCDHGGSARIAESKLAGINKYIGPANFEVAGQPAEGRSGGGLFSSDGRLIGVCNAADPYDDEGIYAAVSVIHEMLTENGQERVFNGKADAVTESIPPRNETGVKPLPAIPGRAPLNMTGAGEIIFFIREPGGASEPRAIILKNPSEEFLNRLHEEHLRQQSRRDVSKSVRD